MDRAIYLFESIVSEGEAAIDQFIEARAVEELFLDFKRSSENGESPHLSSRDRTNLAKAISGFGNSSGGVVVWGVDCSAEQDGTDVARAKVPIHSLQRFLANLQGAVSGCTIPPHEGVQHVAIAQEGTDTGYVVTLIPASQNAPHQTVRPPQYFIRAGSDFVPAPHQVLAGMFGRRPQPNVFPMYTVSPATSDGVSLICEYGVTITNGGPGIARDLFFTAMIQDAVGPNASISWQFLDRDNWSGNFVFGRQLSLMSKPEFRLPPKAFLVPLSLRIELRPPFEDRLYIYGNIGCDQSPTMNLRFERSAAEVEELYNDYFQRVEENDEDETYRHGIPSRLLGIPE